MQNFNLFIAIAISQITGKSLGIWDYWAHWYYSTFIVIPKTCKVGLSEETMSSIIYHRSSLHSTLTGILSKSIRPRSPQARKLRQTATQAMRFISLDDKRTCLYRPHSFLHQYHLIISHLVISNAVE